MDHMITFLRGTLLHLGLEYFSNTDTSQISALVYMSMDSFDSEK